MIIVTYHNSFYTLNRVKSTIKHVCGHFKKPLRVIAHHRIGAAQVGVSLPHNRRRQGHIAPCQVIGHVITVLSSLVYAGAGALQVRAETTGAAVRVGAFPAQSALSVAARLVHL